MALVQKLGSPFLTFTSVSRKQHLSRIHPGLFCHLYLICVLPGNGGGASGRAMAFCPSEPVSNPRTELAFFGNAINLFLLGVGLYLKKTGHRKCYILFLLLSCFLSFKHYEYINCIVSMNQRKDNKIPQKEAGKGPY